MAEQIERSANQQETLAMLAEVLARQAVALDQVFKRAVADALRPGVGSHHDARKALKAQAQCRHTLRILRAVRVASAAKKLSNPSEQTIESGKSLS